MPMLSVKPPIAINHPLAAQISIQESERHSCTPGVSAELAFFNPEGEFVTEEIGPFGPYAGPETGGTRVYTHVPLEEVEAFLNTYRA